MSASPDGSRVYIANYGDNTISVINTATNTVTATIPVCKEPAGLSVSPDGSKVYVAYYGCDTVNVINAVTDTISATIPVCSMAYCLCVSPDGNKVYVTNQSSNTVSVINSVTDSITATITGFNNPVSFGNFISIYPLGIGIDSPYFISAIYPNPAINNLMIVSPQSAIIEIINIQGQTILQQQLQQGKTDIDISGLAKGGAF